MNSFLARASRFFANDQKRLKAKVAAGIIKLLTSIKPIGNTDWARFRYSQNAVDDPRLSATKLILDEVRRIADDNPTVMEYFSNMFDPRKGIKLHRSFTTQAKIKGGKLDA